METAFLIVRLSGIAALIWWGFSIERRIKEIRCKAWGDGYTAATCNYAIPSSPYYVFPVCPKCREKIDTQWIRKEP